MAEISTVARPYAQALFAVACERKAGLEHWAELVTNMAHLVENPDVRALMLDPRLDASHRVQTFVRLLSEKLPTTLHNFIVLLAQNNRLLLLPEIARQFEALKNAHNKITPATITSAFVLTAAQIKDLVAALERKFGGTLEPHVTVDPMLIGGVRVVVGDQVIDTSVQAQLIHMRDALAA